MKMMKTSLLGLTAAAVLGVSSMVVAAPMHHANEQHQAKRAALTDAQKAEMTKKHIERRYANLKLSQAQIGKIEAIEKQYREDMKNVPQTRDLKKDALQNRLGQLREQRSSVLQNKNFNTEQAQKLIQEQQEVRQQLGSLREQEMARHQIKQLQKEHAIFQVLDKKQQQTYLEQAKKPVPMQHMNGKKGHKGKHHDGKPHHLKPVIEKK
ncbi:hypothetical protein ADP71_32480 [Vitreoscilla sp. C1]|uniref:hypothetical protein n=1 Tax=Vitreoscilla sp. (strain C1) TaxID=96942 RepID=UPI00148EB991|nr:hypothetical protein [Vitreoscilla sp. C1]AUZ06417.2 hypothetical protein ADP71_32480 [Vitreoscilla sp. C1]